MRRAIPVTLLIACAWLAAGCGPSGSASSATLPKADTLSEREPVFRTTATELAHEAIADPKAATDKYRGKFIEVDGRIDLANKIVGDKRMVSLVGARKGPKDALSVNVMCLAAPHQREQMWWLGKGQKVKVIGRVTNISPAAVYLDDCTFTEQETNPTATTSAEQLAGEFAKDRAAATKKYQPIIGEKYGKEVIVTGKVTDRVYTRDGFYVARLAGTDRVAVACRLPKEEWQSLKKGETVTVKGNYATFEAQRNVVILNNAFLLEKDHA